ncbi:MAG: hypothetical protein C4287_10175, partial [Leptolyngbya sp. ERB_1_2]
TILLFYRLPFLVIHATKPQSITDVAALANQNSAQSSQISSSFQELLNTAQHLQTSVGQFKVS